MPHAFVIGGTGQVGRAIAGEFLARNWTVTLASRDRGPRPDDLLQKGARLRRVDRDAPDELRSALTQGADAVIDTVAYSESHAAQLLEV